MSPSSTSSTRSSATSKRRQRLRFAAELMPFLPVAFTWFALGVAAKQSRDWTGEGTFLEGWREGFGNWGLTLEQVAFVDAILIVAAAVVLYLDTKASEVGPSTAVAAAPALIDGADVRAAAETMRQAAASFTSVSGAVLDATKQLDAAAERLAKAGAGMTSSTGELTKAVTGVSGLAGDVGSLTSTLAKLETTVGATSKKVLADSTASAKTTAELNELLARLGAALLAFEGGTNRITTAVSHLTGSETRLVDTLENQRLAQVKLGERMVETVDAIRAARPPEGSR
ncbi:MAG TPA: hypothetical protein VFU19_13145 [Iamia sp.]|nr:hypothetical protein [Iamia sp.]